VSEEDEGRLEWGRGGFKTSWCWGRYKKKEKNPSTKPQEGGGLEEGTDDTKDGS